jgi:membrane-associated phospholipid phosphatase
MDGHGVRVARVVLSPLFPLGLPGAYIAAAYATAHWLRRRGRRGGPAIVTSAWAGWFAHRGAKLLFLRDRPHRSGDLRNDSFPSGHTTGATALAMTTAYVLRRERLISTRRALALGLGAPAIMGAYRVIADDHWATDVFAGWLLGSAVALASCLTLGKKKRAPRRRFRREPVTYAVSRDRAGSRGGRARTARPSDR